MDPLRFTPPFAVIRRDGADEVELLTGTPVTADRLRDLPLPDGGTGPLSLALVPYRQIAERGFAHVDDGLPLWCLRVARSRRLPLAELLAALPDGAAVRPDGGFDVPDGEYAETVGAVLRDEIGRGEGSNFVIHRVYRTRVDGDPLAAALGVLRRLLRDERRAYWTFLVHTGDRVLVGATPERHVSVDGGVAVMNPISGTFRDPADRAGLLRFLADPKEINELFMVVDEELKLMARVTGSGARVAGPYLKEMSRLAHTEYLLAGRTELDVRDVLRETMFAPTVVGSPLENACRVVARHERRGRGWYGGVLALLGRDRAGRPTLDAPILIRTAEFGLDGELRIPVGATLVRDSTPAGEVAETYAKAAGLLSACGLLPDAGPAPAPARLAADPEVRATLERRNTTLARFWLDAPAVAGPAGLAGRRVLVADAEDMFTGMFTHLLRSLGMTVDVHPATDLPPLDGYDLVVAGPGPGDPRDEADPRIAALRRLVLDRLASGEPLLAVCLGHQLLAAALGLPLHRRSVPHQGIQRTVDVFGRTERVAFYSTYTARCPTPTLPTPYGTADLSTDPGTGDVTALRGPGFAGIQFHAESVLTERGPALLHHLIEGLLLGATRPS